MRTSTSEGLATRLSARAFCFWSSAMADWAERRYFSWKSDSSVLMEEA